MSWTAAVAAALFFEGAGGAKIAYETFPAPTARGAVVVLSGYSESYVFYADLIADLTNDGLDVYIMDHRGMGRSERFLKNRQIVHVVNAADYGKDVDRFVDQVVTPSLRGMPLFLFAHSTGALVAVDVMERRPELFRKAVLSAPLLRLNTGSWPESVAYAVVAAADAIGFGESYAIGYKDMALERYTFENTRTTHSVERFAIKRRDYELNPELMMGGPSNHWIKVMMNWAEALAPAYGRITTPVLMFQAGQETFVSNEGQDAFCAAAPKCRKIRFEDAHHELFREAEAVREPLIRELSEHLR